MKMSLWSICAGVIACWLASSANADTIDLDPTFLFDQNGGGYVHVASNVPQFGAATIGADPFAAVSGNVLIYQFPTTVNGAPINGSIVTGQVNIESTAKNNPTIAVLRFTNSSLDLLGTATGGGGTEMIVYLSSSGPFPVAPANSNVTSFIDTSGSEPTVDAASWTTPTTTNEAFWYGTGQNAALPGEGLGLNKQGQNLNPYVYIAEDPSPPPAPASTPEPSTLMLVGLGVAGMISYRLRKRKLAAL
jgi:hypothetical protein